MAEKLREVTIKRSQWLRAKKGGALARSGLRVGRKQCCLGFLARTAGYKTVEITGFAFPFELAGAQDSFTPELALYQGAIAAVNDDRDSTDAQKEREIKKLFKQAGYKAVFVD